MECEKCNGTGWVNTWCHGHDVMLKEQCYDCMAHERDKVQLGMEISKLLSTLSRERLAINLAQLLVELSDKHYDLTKLDELVAAKDKEGIMMEIKYMM